MRTYLITTLLALSAVFARAQNTTATASSDTTIYSATEMTASFPGGVPGFTNYLATNIVYPASAKLAHQQGKVFLTFVIEKDGSLNHIRVLRGISPEIDAEAIRVLKASPRWQPAQQAGLIVRQQYTVPIAFTL